MSTKITLKYGENPHQSATLTLDAKDTDPLAIAKYTTPTGEKPQEFLPGMGWVNLTDLDRGVDALSRIAAAFEANLGRVPAIALLVEHGNVAGAATGNDDHVLVRAIGSNYRAAFGAFFVTNQPISRLAAMSMREAMVAYRPLSGVAAPMIDKAGAPFFKRKKGKCHLLVNPALAKAGTGALEAPRPQRTIRGGTLAQTPFTFVPQFPKAWDRQLVADMCLAWGVTASSSSNSVTIAKDNVLIANAVGQQERAQACEVAIMQVKHAKRTSQLRGAAAAIDSYFAFADGLDLLARRKLGAIFATSGSIHDREIAEHARSFDVEFFTLPEAKARCFAGH